MTTNTWRPEEDRELRGLAAQGLGAAQIADVMIKTYWAVHSRARRIGVALQSSSGRAKPRRPITTDAAPEAHKADDVGGRDIGIMGLKPRSCRWPTTTDEDLQQLFCGDLTIKAGGPYCSHHTQLSYAPKPLVAR